jgi:hypothetical protein
MAPPAKTSRTDAKSQRRIHDIASTNLNTPDSEEFQDCTPALEQWKSVLAKKESKMEVLKTVRKTLAFVTNKLKKPTKTYNVTKLRNKIKATHAIINGQLDDTREEVEQVESIVNAFEGDSMIPIRKECQMRLVLRFLQVMHHADQNLRVKDLWCQIYGHLATVHQSGATTVSQ